jgi:hypothetical protein
LPLEPGDVDIVVANPEPVPALVVNQRIGVAGSEHATQPGHICSQARAGSRRRIALEDSINHPVDWHYRVAVDE